MTPVRMGQIVIPSTPSIDVESPQTRLTYVLELLPAGRALMVDLWRMEDALRDVPAPSARERFLLSGLKALVGCVLAKIEAEWRGCLTDFWRHRTPSGGPKAPRRTATKESLLECLDHIESAATSAAALLNDYATPCHSRPIAAALLKDAGASVRELAFSYADLIAAQEVQDMPRLHPYWRGQLSLKAPPSAPPGKSARSLRRRRIEHRERYEQHLRVGGS